MKKVILSFMVILGSMQAAKGNESSKTIYELSVIQGKNIVINCPHSKKDPNYYCASLLANSINEYLSFCGWLLEQKKSNLKASDNPLLCQQAKVQRFNQWVEFQNQSIHAEIDNLRNQ
ncbi:hypothetical protein [Moritella sp. F3]|uniref:hypothetical protein n=1 Tax=Moritella sp. F3 TaxID=2718882 RepID=UPI0018E16C59|nr:hypothetical protein [Moritella sp. F3]GIC77133.1 hypothetical protein FMO001_18600 [Moritella sp. F1]GIC82252.1 hypothetical protein FMO003_25330 [Moritella sp. F3]